ncbi:hypothetical protein JOM56_004738 [Amanita muscaria]
MASEHGDLSSVDLTDINVFGGNEFSQAGDAGPSTSTSSTQIESAQSPSAAMPLAGAENDLKYVGSPMIQRAAGRRRMRDPIYRCPFRNVGPAGCNASFTAPYNLQYHINAHRGFKPHKCNKCSFAAAWPAATRRHQATCKGTLSRYDLYVSVFCS